MPCSRAKGKNSKQNKPEYFSPRAEYNILLTMQIIRHRINHLAELAVLDRRWGAEIDIRSRNGRLILSHDPYKNGDEIGIVEGF